LPVFEIESSAVYFLWHFPSGHPDWPLASILLYGAPTFLDAKAPRSPSRLTSNSLSQKRGNKQQKLILILIC